MRETGVTTIATLAAGLIAFSATAAENDEKQDSAQGEPSQASMTIKGDFKFPETAIHDEKADVYLVSNVNGELGVADSNGFISRVSPDGEMQELKWIDGESGPAVVLHGPKDMVLTDEYLIVADVGAVRYFDRESGEPVRSVHLPDAALPNALALGEDGETVFVSDTGTASEPGALYRLGEDRKPEKIAEGKDLERPNGIVYQDDSLLVAPFEKQADEIYRVSLDGEKESFAKLPKGQLDGLIMLPDDSAVVTSWEGESVYRVHNGGNGEGNENVELIAEGVEKPAQIGYDEKRHKLLVPSAADNAVFVYELAATDSDSAQED